MDEINKIVSNFINKNYEVEKWNHEYEAFNFKLAHHTFKSRLAKKTPKKTGYFVAIWQKMN